MRSNTYDTKLPNALHCALALLICSANGFAAISADVSTPIAGQSSASVTTRPFDAEALISMHRLSDPQLSPDGKQIIYALRETDREQNKGQSSIWSLASAGGRAKRLTEIAFNANTARFSKDGKTIYFLSGKGGSSQLWAMPAIGGAPSQLSQFDLDIGAYQLSPNGKQFAVSFEIFADCGADLSCSKQRLDDTAQKKTTGTLHDKLFIRHWDRWADGTRAQLFVAELTTGVKSASWISKGIDADVPSKPHGDDSEFSFSPDGSNIYFNARIAGRDEAWQTNFDLYRAPIDGSAAPVNLTANNLAWDTTPVVSADGKKLYYRAMRKPGFEADRFRILERDLASGKEREIAALWDRSADGIALSADGKSIYTTALELGHHPLFQINIATGAVKPISGSGQVTGFALGGKSVYFVRDDLSRPADLYATSDAGKSVKKLTDVNAQFLSALRLGAAEQFSFPGWNNELVHAWLVKPVDFDASKTYPIAFLIHGGPQGSFGNQFHYRWNPQTYAGQGFAALMVDFHGSTGYGQAFTDSISGDWGGKPLVDLQKGMAAALAKYPFLDGKRACALGGSYGGYMTNWIAGKWQDGFKCLVTHAGIFDKRFMGYSTEELWFSEWENGGIAWEKSAAIEADNPVTLVKNWQTPMLVIHGMKDFRVPFEQGIAAFTALQRKGIASQFLWFPDENHWILRPENSLQWHQTVNAWLHQHLDEQ